MVGDAGLDGQVDAAELLPLLVGHQADHLADGAEPRGVEADPVARLDQPLAVERVVLGHGVLHFHAAQFAAAADHGGPAFIAAVAEVFVWRARAGGFPAATIGSRHRRAGSRMQHGGQP